MAWTIRPARFNLRFVRAVRKALAKGETICGLEAKTYHLLVPMPGTERSELYTVWLVQDDEGTRMATSRELPEVLVFEDSEGEALAAARVAIEEVLAARGISEELKPRARPSVESGPSPLRQHVA